MSLDEKLKDMDTSQLEKYKKKEKTKAIIGTIVSVIPITAALGFVAGGFIGYELLPYVDTSGMSPEGGFGAAMFTVAAPAVIGGTVSWVSGAAYSAKKWYNTYKASKKRNNQTQTDPTEQNPA